MQDIIPSIPRDTFIAAIQAGIDHVYPEMPLGAQAALKRHGTEARFTAVGSYERGCPLVGCGLLRSDAGDSLFGARMRARGGAFFAGFAIGFDGYMREHVEPWHTVVEVTD